MFKIACVFDNESKFTISNGEQNVISKEILNKISNFFENNEYLTIYKNNVYFFYDNNIEKDFAEFLSDCITIITTGSYENLFTDKIKDVIEIIENYSIKNVDCHEDCNIFTINLPKIDKYFKVLNLDTEEI